MSLFCARQVLTSFTLTDTQGCGMKGEAGVSRQVISMGRGMNTDIRLSVVFWQHPKTKKTVRRLGLEGIRSLQVLWLWAAQNRPDGSLSGMDGEDIELAADWQGEEGAFFALCLGMWIDETPEGYTLHDWQEHNPWEAEAQECSEKARKAARARWGTDKSEDAETMLEHAASNAPLLSSPLPSTPDLSSPDPESEACVCADAGADEAEPRAALACAEFFAAFPEQHRGSRTEAEREWAALKAHRALPGLPRLLDALGQWEDSEAWKRQGGRYVPSAANFLRREYWLRKPPEPTGPNTSGANGTARPRANTVAQKQTQDNDDMAKMLLMKRRNDDAQSQFHASLAGQSGHSLPAGR